MGEQTTTIKQRRRHHFVQVPNETVRDAQLSWKATGLLCYLLSLPDGWKIRLSHISTVKKDGRDGTRAGLAELESAGYLKILRLRDDAQRITGTTWEVSDFPYPENPNTEIPDTEKPTLQILCTQKQSLQIPTTTKGGGDDDEQPPKSKTPTGTVGVQEAGQKTEEALRNVSLADCCLPHQPALAAAAVTAGLDSRGAQKLADALSGALQAPEGDPGRLVKRSNPSGWLKTTAAAIKNGEFKENSAYLSAVAHRQSHAAETGGGGVVKIEPGRYVTQKGALAIVSDRSTVVEIHQADGAKISIPLSRLAAEVAAGSVMLTPVPPDAEAA